jgi:hypothetical protein
MTDINSQDARLVPPLPGGGSWTFDETRWEWVSNDSAPAAPATQDAAPTEAPSADQE